MPTDLAAFALAADQLFPATAPPLPLDVCDGPCCCLPDEQAALVAGPRLAIPSQLYWTYCWAAVGQDARVTAAEIRYFLPRVLAASAAGESPALWEDMVPSKVGFAEPGIYTAAELALVRDFARALVTHLCLHAEPSPPDETHLGEIIAGLACGGLGITTELLALWREHGAAPLARAHFAAMTADLPPNPTPADWCAALWLHAEDTPAELLADLAAWYHDPATSAALT
ncbi:hypothetical protein [Buchananella hordeovulneris]|uniref:hypothetical protein n=1 Tax=Buchananella hordeovulneris TaxID=52770 RepID=UPI000F5DA075|nr:hypothetical protein [Buchananella hordeovulneris]MDO5081219.1 hypothetical protein [Buchananella hordeovulneris]RRD52070.1 hypothetical protein EII12_06195 [Buchananella hordeovulneris]